MVRRQLITKVGVRKIFTATFEKYGAIRNDDGGVTTTILLLDVKSKGRSITDHVWIKPPKETDVVLTKGDKIMFRARVAEYRKNFGLIRDIGLECPTKITKCQGDQQ